MYTISKAPSKLVATKTRRGNELSVTDSCEQFSDYNEISVYRTSTEFRKN
jgi:hypothetical protein